MVFGYDLRILSYQNLGDLRVVPVCPKCGKLISDKKIRRHVERCGSSHKDRLTYELP